MRKNEIKRELDILNSKIDQLTYLTTSNFAGKDLNFDDTKNWYVILLIALLIGTEGYFTKKDGDKE